MEYWKNIKGFPFYSISSMGRVKNNYSGKILNGHDNGSGYLQVALKNTLLNKYVPLYIHRLVAQHFITNRENLPEVDHLNGDRSDNRVENLRWISKRDNLMNRDWCKRPIVMCDEEGNYLKTFKNETEAAQYLENLYGYDYKVVRVAICQVCQGYRPSAYKHRWYFASQYKWIKEEFPFSEEAENSFWEELEELERKRND